MSAGGQALWRISKDTPQYLATDLSGGGAKFTGGRWNRKRTAVVYTSMTIALATLETRAHLGGNLGIRNAFLVRIMVPPQVWEQRDIVAAGELAATWLAEPPGATSIGFGDSWLRGKAAPLLLVPSVIIPEEYNVLINPAHPAATLLSAAVLRQYVYDPRL